MFVVENFSENPPLVSEEKEEFFKLLNQFCVDNCITVYLEEKSTRFPAFKDKVYYFKNENEYNQVAYYKNAILKLFDACDNRKHRINKDCYYNEDVLLHSFVSYLVFNDDRFYTGRYFNDNSDVIESYSKIASNLPFIICTGCGEKCIKRGDVFSQWNYFIEDAKKLFLALDK